MLSASVDTHSQPVNLMNLMAIMTRAHLQRIDLNLLKVFAAVYRERHITRAGGVLFISQSAVSHAIARLRDLFGDPLFVRTPRGMQPTALADRLAEPINRALETVASALHSEESFDPKVARVELRVGMTSLQPVHFLADLYRRIERDAPGVDLLIRTPATRWPDILNSLDDGSVDVLLVLVDDVAQIVQHRRFVSEELFEDPLVCVVARDNPRVGASLDIETYAALPHLMIASERVSRTWIDDSLAERGLRRRVAVTAPHPNAIAMLTPGTQLIATVAKSLVEPHLSDGRLRLLKPPIGTRRYSLQMIWSSRNDSDPATVWLRDSIRRCCRGAARFRNPPKRKRPKR